MNKIGNIDTLHATMHRNRYALEMLSGVSEADLSERLAGGECVDLTEALLHRSA